MANNKVKYYVQANRRKAYIKEQISKDNPGINNDYGKKVGFSDKSINSFNLMLTPQEKKDSRKKSEHRKSLYAQTARNNDEKKIINGIMRRYEK